MQLKNEDRQMALAAYVEHIYFRLALCNYLIIQSEAFFRLSFINIYRPSFINISNKCDITEDELNIIMQSRKTLLFHDNHPWVKKNGEEDFDVPMGCNNGAEICETTGSNY